MKKIITILILMISISHFAQDCNIGNEDSTGFDNSADPFWSNYLLGVKFSLDNNGTLQSLNLLGRNTDGQVQMAVYNDNNGVPGNLIVSSNIDTVGFGVVSLPVSPTPLLAGDYWVMAIYDIDGGHTYNTTSDTGNVVYYTQIAFGEPIPTNASNFTSFNDYNCTYFMEISCEVVEISDYSIANKFNIYPNPTTDFLNLKGDDNIESIKVFDINGMQVFSNTYNTSSYVKIDLTYLTNGFYTALINENQRLKIIKK